MGWTYKCQEIHWHADPMNPTHSHGIISHSHRRMDHASQAMWADEQMWMRQNSHQKKLAATFLGAEKTSIVQKPRLTVQCHVWWQLRVQCLEWTRLALEMVLLLLEQRYDMKGQSVGTLVSLFLRKESFVSLLSPAVGNGCLGRRTASFLYEEGVHYWCFLLLRKPLSLQSKVLHVLCCRCIWNQCVCSL